MDNFQLNDDYVETKRKQAENEINSAIYSRYVLPLSEVPNLIEYICTQLAAGYIDYEQFGADGVGKKWLGEARAILKSIQDGKQRLLDSDYNELTTVTKTNVIRSYPDSTLDDSATEGVKFTVGHKF